MIHSDVLFRRLIPALALILLLATQAACSPATPQPTETPAPTSTPLPSATPPPTDTPTPTSTPTRTPTATPNREATSQAKATATQQAKMDLVAPVLKNMGLSTDAGQLAWFEEEPILLMVQDYNSFTYTPLGEDQWANYVIHSKITWDSSSGLAGCGMLLRSDGNLDTGKHYEFDLLRLQNAPAWEMFSVKYHYIDKYLTRYKFDNIINDGKLSVNTLEILVQGKQFTPYINGEKKITMENSDLTEGYIYVIAHQESGLTTCMFENTWVWTLD